MTTLYELIEKECLTDGLDFEHRRCNTTKLKKICDELIKVQELGVACIHYTYGVCANCIAEKLMQEKTPPLQNTVSEFFKLCPNCPTPMYCFTSGSCNL